MIVSIAVPVDAGLEHHGNNGLARGMDHRIVHTCGHEQSHHLTGFDSQQQRRADWLKTTLCASCYRAEKAAESERALTKAQGAIAHLTLVPLTGSERQVSWATAIRAQRIAMLRTACSFTSAETGAALLGIADAKWWIDQRELTDEQLLERAGATPLTAR